MAKWEIVYRETVVRSVVVEANDRSTAVNKVIYNSNYDTSDAVEIGKPRRKEFMNANKLED